MTTDEARDSDHHEQPPPGATGHEQAEDSDLEVEPEADPADRDGDAGDQSEQADQESKHSLPSSDPPANY